MSDWTLIKDRANMYRPKGKTWPQVEYSNGAIYARDNNGKRPSPTLNTKDLTLEGLNQILKGISLPHPSEEQKRQFILNIK